MLPGLSIIAAVCGFGNQFRENSSSTEIGEESRKYGGTVGDGRRDEQQPSCAFPQIGNGRDNQSDDNERNGKGEKLPNSPLKVTNIRATGTGRNCPSAIPVAMAMRTCHRREIRNFFITLMLLAKIGKYSLLSRKCSAIFYRSTRS